MAWTTPTKRAEARYQAERAKRAPKAIVGPDGISIPDPRTAYRKTIDGPLLSSIVVAVTKAYRAEQLPAAYALHAGYQIAVDIRGRYPPADMAVLKRYGCGTSIDRVPVEFNPHVEDREWLQLGQPVAVPDRRIGYVVHLPDAAISPADSRVVPPAEALAYLMRVIDVRRVIREEITPAGREPGQFAVREKRQPTWAEIEAAWPRVGAWMAAQREAGR